MAKSFIGSAIMKPSKFKGSEKIKSSSLKGIESLKSKPAELGSLSMKDQEKFKGAEKPESECSLVGANKLKYSPSSMPSAKKTNPEDMMQLDSFIKSNKMKPMKMKMEMDPEEAVHNAKEESEEGYNLSPKAKQLSEESPKIKKRYEEWLKKKKHLKMMGE